MNTVFVTDFIDKLYRKSIPESSQILIWTLPDKKSYWVDDDAGKILTLAEQLVKETKDVYIGVGLAPSGLKGTQRARIDQINAIPAFWLDIDFKDPVHVKKNLPSEIEAKIFIRDEVHPSPTFIIHTGHGYHLWWALDKPYLITNNDHRVDIQNRVSEFTGEIKIKMQAHGWTLDSTFDLSRVLRLPGTVNFKNEPLDVKIEQFNELYYKLEQLSSGMETRESPAKRKTTPKSEVDSNLRLDPEAQPTMDKWMALQENEPKAIRSWNRTRKDFTDHSASSYDLSLASIAFAAGWSDQEIVNLLIASRRHHGDDLKLREDYYQRTLSKAKSTSSKVIEKHMDDAMDQNDPDASKDALSNMFGIEIKRLIKFEGDPPTYVLQIKHKGTTATITLGGVESILEQRLFRAKIASVADIVIPKVTPTLWDKRAQALMGIIEVEELGPDSTPAGAVMAWVHEYLEMYRPSVDENEAIKASRPFIKEGSLHIFLRPFSFWLRTNQGERMTNRELSRYMRMAGFEQYVQFVKADDIGDATSRSIWKGKLS